MITFTEENCYNLTRTIWLCIMSQYCSFRGFCNYNQQQTNEFSV